MLYSQADDVADVLKQKTEHIQELEAQLTAITEKNTTIETKFNELVSPSVIEWTVVVHLCCTSNRTGKGWRFIVTRGYIWKSG